MYSFHIDNVAFYCLRVYSDTYTKTLPPGVGTGYCRITAAFICNNSSIIGVNLIRN